MLAIRASDRSYLDFDGGSVQGKAVASAGTTGSLFVRRAGLLLCWQADAFTEMQARGTAVGSSGSPDGFLCRHLDTLRFVIAGSEYLVQARPYTPISLSLYREYSDGNIFGSTTETVSLLLNGAAYTVPAGFTLRLTTFQWGMTNYDYAGNPSFNWTLLGTGISGSANGLYRSGTPDAPLATYTAGQGVTVYVDYNNITTHGAVYAVSGVLVPN